MTHAGSSTIAGAPGFVAGLCVHEWIETGSCEVCVEACPREAIALDDEGLTLDSAACDGCGLCVGACPQEAITMNLPGERRATAPVVGAVDLVCDLAAEAQAGVTVPCVHALGWPAIVRLYHRGGRSLRVSCGDCDQCERAPEVRLEQTLVRVNELLASRGLPSMALERAAKRSRWSWWKRSEPPVDEGRRRLLRRVVPIGSEDDDNFAGAAAMLPAGGPSSVQPCVPSIDAARCTGCNACASLCPTGAIVHESDTAGSRYRIRASHCTGCGICTDVCDASAVTLTAWSTSQQDYVALRDARCPKCGVVHHSPRPREDRLCAICARVGPGRRLFVVESDDDKS